MREKLVELIKQIVIPFWAGEIADHLLSNDVVPVVRCRECKHWTVDGAGNRWCHMWETHQTHEDVFCCFGERKDGEG